MSWQRAEEIRREQAVSQTDKERVIAEIWNAAFNEEGDELKSSDLEAAYDAGYRAAREDAAKIAEEIKTDSGFQVAAAIRKLEPKP